MRRSTLQITSPGQSLRFRGLRFRSAWPAEQPGEEAGVAPPCRGQTGEREVVTAVALSGHLISVT